MPGAQRNIGNTLPSWRAWLWAVAWSQLCVDAVADDDLVAALPVRRLRARPQPLSPQQQLLEHRWKNHSSQAKIADLGLVILAGVGTPTQELHLRLDTGQYSSWIATHGAQGTFDVAVSSTLQLAMSRRPAGSRRQQGWQEHVLSDQRRYRGLQLLGNLARDVVRLQRCALDTEFLLVEEAPRRLLQLGDVGPGGDAAAAWQGTLGLWPANASAPQVAVLVLAPFGDPVHFGHYELLLSASPRLRGVLPGPPLRWSWVPLDAAGRAPADLEGHYSSGRHINVVVDTTTTFLLAPPGEVPQLLEELLPRPVWYLCSEARPALLIYCDCDAVRRFMAPLHIRLRAEPEPVTLLLTTDDLLEPLPVRSDGHERCMLRVAAGRRPDALVVGELLLRRYTVGWDLAQRRLGIAPAPTAGARSAGAKAIPAT